MKAASATTRWSELDGLRCLAVAGVLAVHFAPGRFGNTPWADWGVRLFFVLSGFLITDGLLRLREQPHPGRALREFFIRRALRLWPLYFAVLAVTWTLDLRDARELLPWNAAFATNIAIYRNDVWPELFSHFWTLAVEQQFYVIWPFLILFVSPRLTVGVMFFLVIASPLSRAWEFASLLPAGGKVVSILLPMSADYLAWGGLLAVVRRKKWLAARAASSALPCALAILVALGWARSLPQPSAAMLAVETSLFGVASVLLVAHCIGSTGSWLRTILRLPPLVYLGTISYGIYVLHNFAHWAGPSILRRLTGENYFNAEWAHVSWLVALSITAASASWHCFERPLATLGKRALEPNFTRTQRS